MRYFDDNIVLETLSFIHRRGSAPQGEMTVCYGTDASFMPGAAVSAFSVAAENPQSDIAFHIFTNGIDDIHRARFEAFAENERVSVVIHIINSDLLTSLPENKLWSTAIYYRFIIADYFYQKKEKVLYLDSDIVCTGPLQPLFDIGLEGNTVAAVTERDERWWANRAESLGEKALAKGYYNSGVLLIDTQRWYQQDVTPRAVALLRDPDVVSRLSYYDQDVLNLITCGRVLFIDRKYNVQYSLNYELQNRHPRPNEREAVLLHYIGPTKPWHAYACGYDISGPYTRAKSASPWRDVAFQSPRTSMQFRYAAKHSFKQRQQLAGIKYYCLYFKAKLTQ